MPATIPRTRTASRIRTAAPIPTTTRTASRTRRTPARTSPRTRTASRTRTAAPDPDNDKDGILDVKDKCPNEPETFNGFQDEDGCPDKGIVVIDKDNILILKKIKFETASAEILPRVVTRSSTPSRRRSRTTPSSPLIEVAGHADERATDEYNLRLTQDRVNSVMAALVAAQGRQEQASREGLRRVLPAEDPGHNEEAWEKNRRVEFKIVKTKEGPTNVELGCEAAAIKGVKPDSGPLIVGRRVRDTLLR